MISVFLWYRNSVIFDYWLLVEFGIFFWDGIDYIIDYYVLFVYYGK